MAARNPASIDLNHHKGLVVSDEITGAPFGVQGQVADGSINVNVVGGGGGGGNGAILDYVNPLIGATVLDLTNSNPLTVGIVDASGNQISSFGGGTQYVEGVTTSPGTGTIALGRYNTSPPTLTNGQLNAPQLDVNGNLKVTVTNGASGGTSSVDDSAFTAGVGSGTPMMGFATADTVDSGDVGVLAMDINRNLKVIAQSNSGVDIGDVTINNASGASAVNIQDGGNSITVDNAGTFPVQLNASQTTTTGSITTSTTTITVTDLAGVGAVTVGIFGTYAGVNVTFEMSLDGTNWVVAIAVPANSIAPTPIAGTTGVLVTNSTNVWNVSPLLGVAQFRVRATAFGSGSASVRIEPSAQFTQPTAVVTSPTAANFLATVVGTGAFVTQATLSAETTKVIGTVNQGTSPWVVSNATTSVVGNGAAATAQRVTIANDSTGVLASIGSITTGVIPGVTANSLGKAEDAGHTSSDVGVFALAVRNDNAATSVTTTNADYSQISTDITGTVFTRSSPANTSTLSNVAASATSVTVLAANPARRLATFYNDSTSDCYMKFGTTASTSSFNLFVASLGSVSFNGEDYAGIVTAIWNSATGNMRVGETTI